MSNYLLGIIFAIIAGLATNFGIVLEKKVINRLPEGKKVGKHLFKEPVWVLGLVTNFGVSTVFFMIAELFIGPALIPGLMASGLIILVIGSLKITNEEIKSFEILGISLMISSIFLLGFSGLIISVGTYNFTDTGFIIRLILTTVILFIGSVICNLMIKMEKNKGIFHAIDSGIYYSISNLWVALLIGIIANIFSGAFIITELILFIAAAIILPLVNFSAVFKMNKSLEYGQATNMFPIQQVAIQITPLFFYLVVFLLIPPFVFSLPLAIIGIALILVSMYFLAKRQVDMEKIK